MSKTVTKAPGKRRIRRVKLWPTEYTIHLDVRDDHTTALLRQILAQGEKLIMAAADLKAAVARIDIATSNIAADIQAIKAKIGTGMTDAEVAEVQAALDASAARLEALDAENPDGQPPTP